MSTEEVKALVEALRVCASAGACKTCERDLYCEPTKMLSDAAAAIEDLQAQLQKRGEWVKGPDGIYHCSVCGATAPYLDAFDGVIQYWENLFYCNRCGAKMEAQE